MNTVATAMSYIIVAIFMGMTVAFYNKVNKTVMGGAQNLVTFVIIYNVIALIALPILSFRFAGVTNSYLVGIHDAELVKLLDLSLLYIGYFLFVFYLISVWATKITVKILSRKAGKVVSYNYTRIRNALTVFSVVVLVTACYAIFISKTSPLLLFLDYSVTTGDLVKARSVASQAGGMILLFQKEIFKNYGVYLFPILLALKYEGLQIKKISVSYILILTSSIVSTVWFLEKAAIIYFTLSIVCIRLIYGKKYDLGQISMMLIAAILVVIISYLALYPEEAKLYGSSYFYDLILHRYTTQSVGFILSLHYFPSEIPFRMLSGISNALSSIQGVPFQSTYAMLIDYVSPQSANVSGAMSSFVAGDAWGLFGFPGLVICPLVCGIYYGIANLPFASNTKLVTLPLTLMLFTKPVLASSFYGFLYPVGFALILVPFWLLLFTSKKRTRYT